MQKVERKKHREIRHRRWIWLAAAFVLLAGSVTAAVLLSREPEPVQAAEPRWGMLIDREAEELVSVTVERRGDRLIFVGVFGCTAATGRFEDTVAILESLA